MAEIILATGNRHKAGEIEYLMNLHFPGEKIRILSLKDVGFHDIIVEDGLTFEENAEIKASAVFMKLRRPCLADDSGLCVDILGGAPGVYSARYAGENAADDDNNNRLIAELSGYSGDDRKARFVCSLCCISAGGDRHTVTAYTDYGIITDAPAGTGGFGYDPLFYYPPLGVTFGELTLEQKCRHSHRARAINKLQWDWISN